MADIVFNVAKGRIAHYGALLGTNDALIVVPIETADIVSDAAMKDYATLADVLADGSIEQTSNMVRKTGASVTVTPDNTNDWVDVDMADITWAAATGNPISALLVCYDPDTTGGSDSDIIPLTKHDFVATPNGGDITAQPAAGGFYRAN